MALKWIDGGEIWADAAYLSRVYGSASGVFTGTPGRVSPGQRHYLLNNGHLTTPSLGVQNTWTVGFGLNIVAATTPWSWQFLSDAAEQCRLEAYDRGDGKFGLRLKRGSTTVASTSGGFTPGAWHYFELQIAVRTGANGAYELRHNEMTLMSDTGVDLADTGSDGCDVHSFGHNSGGILMMDDIYVCDDQGEVNDDFLGDSVAIGLLPSADGAATDWTPSTGADHYALVDDSVTLPDNNDYVSSSTPGDQDLYEFQDLPASGLGDIHGVQLSIAASVETIGSRVLKAIFRNSGGSVADGDDFSVDGTFTVETPVIWDVEPNGSSAWTKSDIDGGQFGVEVVS